MYAPNNFAGAAPFNDWFAPDTVQRHPLGYQVEAVDPFWGFGLFQYVKSNDAILKGSICIVGTPNTYLATLFPNTANLGQPFGVAMAPMASGTFGWLLLVGNAVYVTNATVAADAAIGLGAAGIAGTNSAGKQLLNTHNLKSATATATVSGLTTNGSSTLQTGGYDGFFLGMALSGTGIPASTVVAKLDPDGRTIYMGSVIGTINKTATATGTVTVTGTYTGYGLGFVQYGFTQGAIT
jgi:hypothetical protein